jgi:hypothetical protein
VATMSSGSLSFTTTGATPEIVLAELKATFEAHGFPDPKEITLRGPHYGQREWLGTAKGEK